MQAKTFSFFRAIIALLSVPLLGAAAVFLVNPAHAQIAVAGHPSQGPAITGVVSKGAGQADVTITSVQLKSSLSYCLVGVGRGHWHAKKVDGNTQFDLTKVACAKSEGGKVVVPLRLEAKYYQGGGLTMGYVPVTVQVNGMLVDWQPYPSGSLKFEKNDGRLGDIIAIHWTADGYATLATADQALNIND